LAHLSPFPRSAAEEAVIRPALDACEQRLERLKSLARENKNMKRYNILKLKALSIFANAGREWLKPSQAAERLNFWPSRSAWTYFKRLWRFGLLERRSSGRGSLEYRISEGGAARLRWLLSRKR
jgi:hypothetical protein